MRNIIAILLKELRITFTTPIAYAALTVFTLTTSVFFLRLLSDFQQEVLVATQMQPELLQYMNFTDALLQPLFYNVAVLFIFVVPFLTMRLIAEERRNRTFELLQTSPVSPLQIALGKYLAVLMLVLSMVLLVVLYPLLVMAYAEVGGPSWGTVTTALLGLFLAGAAFAAVGLFVSALTNSQVVAAAVTFCVLLLLWVAGWAAGDSRGVTREILSALSAIDHIRGFARGVIDLRDVTYYLSLIVLGLYLTRRALEAQRWR